MPSIEIVRHLHALVLTIGIQLSSMHDIETMNINGLHFSLEFTFSKWQLLHMTGFDLVCYK